MSANDKIAPAAYIVIASLLLLLSYPALAWLIQSWQSNPYYSHGFLVPPIALLLAWLQRRHVLAQPRQGGAWLGLLIAATGLAVVIWAMRWQDYAVAILALVALLVGVLLYLEGWPRLRPWLFPLFFLAFMVPVPAVDLASPWFESLAARSATALARLAGIAAVQQGGEITLPNTAIAVGAPCSGLRSLVAMATVGVVWVYLVEGRLVAKALMLAAILPLVVLSNVLRISILLIVASTLGAEAALSYYHDWSSPILFLMALGLFLLWGKMLSCSQLRADIL